MAAKKTPTPSPAPDDNALILGRLINRRRREAGMSRATLAVRANISESTLKNLEAGRHRPSQLTLTQLVNIPELGLQPADLVPGGSAQPEGSQVGKPPMNCWISPGFDPIAMVQDLTQRLAGRGGPIEQSFLYLDSKSAACWFSIANQATYASTRDLKHMHTVVERIRALNGDAGLDVIGLGCGDGRKEVRLMHLLMAGAEPGRLCLYLMDISQPLLGYAFKNAVETLSNGASVFAIQGNFHHFPFYTQLLHTAGKTQRRRLLCMFGGTFGNLENEVRFVRNNLVGLTKGDLLLLHVSRCYAPRDRPDEVERLDPQLAGKMAPELRALEKEWLTGPIERYSRPVGAPLPEMEVQAVFDTSSCPVPGSYAIEKCVMVKSPSGNPRRFTMTYVKRYEGEGLAACMEELGWKRVQIWDDELGNHLLCLFRWDGDQT